MLKPLLLFVVTAFFEILGCYLPSLYLNQGRSVFWIVPGLFSLAVFAWLLSFHPEAAGRVYAAYGGVYICVALAWLRYVDGVSLSVWDVTGALVALCGMGIIMSGPTLRSWL